MTDDFIGQTLGQYRIEAPLGSGGMGQVYRGVHRLLNRPAAIKVMQAHLAANPDFRARFLREAQSAAALKHFNIVEIYDFGEQDGHLYLVMELMTDGSLHTLLRHTTGQPLPLTLGLDLVQQAAKGLAAAQALHMVHRDIKPDNLLLNRLSEAGQGGEQYVLKISDFGLARLAESGLTNTGVPMGTLAYMSPEQCQSKKLDGRSDLYSLGIVFYEVVTGYKPFQINDFSEALDKHVNVLPKPPREMRPYLPPGLEEIILRCLAKKPEERYATGTELVSALQRALGNVGPQTTTQPHPSPEQLTPTGGTALQPPGAGGTPPPVVSTLATYTAVPRVRVLDQGGQTLQVVDVKSQGLIVGRQPGNDLVLSDQAISHRHLQVMWDGKQVTVKDLGSSNGTLLEGVRLLPQENQPWMERQLIRIGPFWLRLEGPSPVGTQTVQKAVPQTAAFGTTGVQGVQTSATMVRSGRIGMAVNPRMLTITPGQPANIQVILTNLGSIVDWFTTTVEGVAPEWVQGARQEVQLNPGMQETVELNVNVARSANNFAQEYPVTIRARSREQPNESGTVQVRWHVLPFTEDVLRLEPRRAGGRGSASYAIALQNGGNTPAHYELSGEDDEQKIGYQFGSNPVDLAPGREARVPLAVRTRRHWIGREQRQPFQIHARPAGSSIPLTAPGEFVNKALLPGWLLAVVGIVVTAGVVLGALLGPLRNSSGTIVKTTPTVGATIVPTVGPTITPTVGPTATTGPSQTVTTTPSPTASATGSGLVIKTATATINGKSVTILTNAQGLTLYYRTSDSSSSVCSGGCASAWPPVLVTGSVTPTSSTSLPGKLSVSMNANGEQVAYNGHPLYTYSGDSGPGQTNGQGLGGIWFVVTTDLASGQVAFKPGGISFIGPVKSITSTSLVMSAPDGQTYTMEINAQTDHSAFGGNLPTVGASVNMVSAANPDGSFTATILKPAQAGDPNLNAIAYTGITTSAVGADRVIHFTVGVKSYTFTIPTTAVLSDFGGNAQAIGNNVPVKVSVQFPSIAVVSVGNPNA